MSLPAQLELNPQNLQRLCQDNLDTVFIFLHLILNTLLAIGHCPSLFRAHISQITEVDEKVSSVSADYPPLNKTFD